MGQIMILTKRLFRQRPQDLLVGSQFPEIRVGLHS